MGERIIEGGARDMLGGRKSCWGRVFGVALSESGL